MLLPQHFPFLKSIPPSLLLLKPEIWELSLSVSFSSSSASLHLLGFVDSVSRLCLEAIYFSPCSLLLQ